MFDIKQARHVVTGMAVAGHPAADRNVFDQFIERYVHPAAYSPEILEAAISAVIDMMRVSLSPLSASDLSIIYLATCKEQAKAQTVRLVGGFELSRSDIENKLLDSWEPTLVGKHDRTLRRMSKLLAVDIEAGKTDLSAAIQLLAQRREQALTAIRDSRKPADIILSEEEQQRAAIREEARQRELAESNKRREAMRQQQKEYEAESARQAAAAIESGHVSNIHFDKNGVMVGADFVNGSAPRPQEVRHTLQIAQIGATTFADLGQLSYHAFLTDRGFDVTNAQNERTAWARDGGWHRKDAVHIKSGEVFPILISFDGKGGELPAVTVQKATAARMLVRGRQYAENKEREEVLRRVTPRPRQAAFRASVYVNFSGACAVTDIIVDSVLQAAHIKPFSEGGSDMTDNGLLLRSDIHQLFDAELMAINPATMRAHFSKRVVGYEQFEGREIISAEPLNHQNLAARWAAFQESEKQ